MENITDHLCQLRQLGEKLHISNPKEYLERDLEFDHDERCPFCKKEEDIYGFGDKMNGFIIICRKCFVKIMLIKVMEFYPNFFIKRKCRKHDCHNNAVIHFSWENNEIRCRDHMKDKYKSECDICLKDSREVYLPKDEGVERETFIEEDEDQPIICDDCYKIIQNIISQTHSS